MFAGIELVRDRDSKEPEDESRVIKVVSDCQARGVLVGRTNRSLKGLNNTLTLSPALIATRGDIDKILATIDGALRTVYG